MVTNIKWIFIALLVGGIIWFYKDARLEKLTRKAEQYNIEQLKKKYEKQDSTYFGQLLSKKELDQYLTNNNKELKQFLTEQNNIQLKRVQRIITQNLHYQDTIINNIDLDTILKAIKANKEFVKVPIVDSTDCLIVKGFVVFEKDTLSLQITERIFNNKTDIVAYMQRKQWKFLFIKSRLFGKRKLEVIVKDDCGKTTTTVVDIQKKKK